MYSSTKQTIKTKHAKKTFLRMERSMVFLLRSCNTSEMRQNLFGKRRERGKMHTKSSLSL